MKRTLFTIAILLFSLASSQFKISIQGPADFNSNYAYLYSLNGSKDVLLTKIEKSKNSWTYQVPKEYVGMMKIYFPESNNSFIFISENKDIDINFLQKNNKISSINYLDESNKLMDEVQDFQRKKELILPALYQINDYYKPNSDFGTALAKEINRLSAKSATIDPSTHPFVHFYNTNYKKFLEVSASEIAPSQSDMVAFLTNSNYLLESSSLLRPILLNYINADSKVNADVAVDQLLKSVNVETPRGQTILSELIEIFDASEMTALKDKYLALAGNLKCSINDRLASTIQINKNLALNAKFPNYKFTNPTNTTAKSIHEVKADKKVVVFWSSTCSHCEQELPSILEVYQKMKSQNMEVIGLSLDNNKEEYQKKASAFPWINDSELKGWYSTFNETYNIHATPTYFVLDKQNNIIAKPDHVGDVLEFLKLK